MDWFVTVFLLICDECQQMATATKFKIAFLLKWNKIN